jgi:hypothetical protein
VIVSNSATGMLREVRSLSKDGENPSREQPEPEPETEVVVRPQRRKWTAVDKERVECNSGH